MIGCGLRLATSSPRLVAVALAASRGSRGAEDRERDIATCESASTSSTVSLPYSVSFRRCANRGRATRGPPRQ